jgi:hypothetical protein
MTAADEAALVALIETSTRSMLALGECMSQQLAAMQGISARLDVIENALVEVVQVVREARATGARERAADVQGATETGDRGDGRSGGRPQCA